MSPRIAIILPTKDATQPYPQRALAAVKATTKHLDVGVHIVEGGGPDWRFSRSITRGIAMEPDADAFVLLNDDAFMDAGWLDAMLETVEAHPKVGGVAAVLRYPDGRIQHAGGHIPLYPMEFLAAATARKAPFWGLRLLREHKFQPFPYMFAHYHTLSPRHRLDFLTGACYLLTKECYQKVGAYDDKYEFGSEDVDHTLRVLEGGFELAIAMRATGIHLDGASSTTMSDRSVRSMRTFQETWPAERIARVTRGRHGVYHA